VTTAQAENPLEAFQWKPQPQAEALVTSLAEELLSRSAFARVLRAKLNNEAGIRILDLIDSIHVPRSADLRKRLAVAGFVHRPIDGIHDHYVQEQGIFPAIVLRNPAEQAAAYLKVESAADFLAVWQIDEPVSLPLAPLRTVLLNRGEPVELWAIERHGCRGFAPTVQHPQAIISTLLHHQAFRLRRRCFGTDDEGFTHAELLIDSAIADLGRDRTCDLFFAAEREYWQRRNRAGQVQKARQDKLGIGWANHDHHTYRSSREHFARLIGVFEKLGFRCRERFYAGHQTGWGAQILEQPIAGIVIFADVDLSPDELMGDFSHDGLSPRDSLGTVGLWCALHGEAFLEAGMHHLECQFDFELLKQQLEGQESVQVMKPFTNFPYLRQAFTEGEIWPVRPERIERLLKAGRITADQAKHFRDHGALGSHLENLERNQGFKGFNQTGVSEIISRTDPRAQAGQH